MSCWSVLGIEPTKDAAAVKRAYAAKSREVHPEDSPEQFRILHEAYLAALAYGRQAVPAESVPFSAPSSIPDTGIAREETAHYRDIIFSSEKEKAEKINSAVESALSGLDQLISSGGSVDDYVAVLGTPVTIDAVQTEICFFAAFAAALTDFIKARKKLPKRFYEAVTLVYEFAPGLGPSPAKDLQALYNVMRERKKLMTQKERKLAKLNDVFIYLSFLLVASMAVYKESSLFLAFFACAVVFLVLTGITSAKRKKKRSPGPYSAELRKYRQRRALR